jgi:hypothetical protein
MKYKKSFPTCVKSPLDESFLSVSEANDYKNDKILIMNSE